MPVLANRRGAHFAKADHHARYAHAAAFVLGDTVETAFARAASRRSVMLTSTVGFDIIATNEN